MNTSQEQAQQPQFIDVCVKVQGGETHAAQGEWMGEEIGYLVCVPREWQPQAQAQELPDDLGLIWECIYDHGNGQHLGEKSKTQRDAAFAAIERIRAALVSAEKLAADRLQQMQVDRKQALQWRGELAAKPVPDVMAHIAMLAHSGGLSGLSESDALTAIRRLSTPAFKLTFDGKDAKAKVEAAIKAAGGER